MSRSDDRREKTLPVTAEVGGEGGSYADPTLQVPTFDNDIPHSDDVVPEPLTPDAERTPRMRRDVSE